MIIDVPFKEAEAEVIKALSRKIDIPIRQVARLAILGYLESHKDDTPQWKLNIIAARGYDPAEEK
jgi:hypothetical protein